MAEVPPEVINNPEFLDLSGRLAGYGFGITLGLLPFLAGIVLARKYWKNRDPIKRSRSFLYPLMAFGLIVFTIFSSGFYILGSNEAAITVGARKEDYYVNSWTDLLSIKEKQVSGYAWFVDHDEEDPILNIFGKHLYWHTPLGKVVQFGFHEDFQVSLPLVAPIYQYEYDREGNVKGLLYDDLDAPMITGYIFFTSEGLKLYAPTTWSRLRYSPDFELNVIQVTLDGQYDVTSPRTYSHQVSATYMQNREWFEEYGYYAELVDPPDFKTYLEQGLLYNLFRVYFFQVKFPYLLDQIIMSQPFLSEELLYTTLCQTILRDPLIVTRSMGDIPTFLDFMRSFETTEQLGFVVEWYFGIRIRERLQVKVYEETM